MSKLTVIQDYINNLLDSSTIDEKRRIGSMALGWYKQESNNLSIPIAIKLNAQLELKEAIENYLIHDNQESIKKLLASVMQVSFLLEQTEAA